MKKLKKIYLSGLSLAISLLAAQTGYGAVSADEAKVLGSSLTTFGASAGASKDGAIPAYEGGLKNPPKVGTNNYPDPFAGEKPLYSIQQSNMAQYKDQLGAGTIALLERFPDYKVDVYPTHRTMAYPDWFLENTVKNATTATVGGAVEGDKVAGAAPDGLPYQGIPYPVPKTGYEVMWNHFFRYAPPVSRLRSSNWLVDSNGNQNSLPGIDAAYLHPWSEKTGEMRKKTFDSMFGFWTTLFSPPTSAGTQFLNYYLPDATDISKVWFYTPGQRRVRRAPEFTYDTPMGSYAGVIVWDEPFGFVGRMDRFNMKLVGKQEMIVPYNVFGVTNQSTSTEILGKQFIKPQYMRWEKRNVWVVEADRKKDERHAYSKRKFYVEEDCWCLVGTESYDDGGKIWRVSQILNFPTWDIGGMNSDTWMFQDLRKGNYIIINAGRTEPGNYVRSFPSDEKLNLPLNPKALQSSSAR